MQENKNKYYDIAERIYDLDGEVYECVGSSLGRTFTGDKRTCVNNLVMLMRTKPQGHLLRSELALISNMARTIRKDEDRSRLMKKYGAHIIGGLHIKMPDCICDVKTLKRSIPQNRKLIKDATNKLIKAAHQLKENRPPQEGINVFYHIAGLLGQRLWFYNKTRSYTDQLHIDPNACICCGKCAGLCPMKNISIIDNRVQAHDQCTMCYRCINQCPQRAITLIGKEVIEQHRVEDFL